MEFDIVATRVRSFKVFDPVNGFEIGTFYTNGKQALEIQNRYYDRILEILKAGMAALDKPNNTQSLPSDWD